MEIYLVRHGAPYTREEDPERHLNNDGIKQCHLTGKALKCLGISLDLVVSSPKPRARQTAEIIAEEVGYSKDQIEITETLEPNVPAKDTIAFLKKYTDKNRILLAGHLPSVENIASELMSDTAHLLLHFAMNAVCRINVEHFSSHNGELCWFLLPEHLTLIAQSKI